LEKIHLKMKGYISKQQMAAVKEIDNNESVFDNLIRYVPLQEYQVKLVQACKETLLQMRGMPPRHAIRVIRDRLGYEKALEKMCERFGYRKEVLIGILNTLEEIADGLETMEEFASRLHHLASVLKTSKSRRGQNAVTFSTFHSSKGLEFERVYMIDLIEGIIPSSDDMKRAELVEEATRLFYVGMTRAKKHLELITYRERDGEKVDESQFVANIRMIMNPPEQAEREKKRATRDRHNPNAIKNMGELKMGDFVRHRVFGRGEIVQLSEETIEIRVKAGLKKLSAKICLEMGLLEQV
jgi:DNA helicase-2/ATP-dependent DNA helicase PcrA